MPGIQSDSPMSQRALPSSIDDLTRAVSSLESTIYSLQSQLHPVLDSEQLACGDGVKSASNISPHQYSVQISDVASRIRSLTQIGSDLLTRLHV